MYLNLYLEAIKYDIIGNKMMLMMMQFLLLTPFNDT
jgi:hypothetical protein